MALPAKSLRLLYILEAVERLKVASPADVLVNVAARTGTEAENANFKRNIYRDLKTLADDGRLQTRHLTPEGSEIHPDDLDAVKNLRLEYSLNGLGTVVPGAGLIHELGGQFVAPRKRSLDWKFVSLNQFTVKDHIGLIASAGGRLLGLQLPLNQLPAKILFSRADGSTLEPQILRDEAAEQYGLRTACYFAWDPSVSRHSLGRRLGHALLVLGPDGRASLTDLSSSSGTQWAAVESAHVTRWLVSQKSTRTEPAGLNPLNMELDFQPITNAPQTLSLPAVLQLGNFRMLLVCN